MRVAGLAVAAALLVGGAAQAASPEAQAYVALDECNSQAEAMRASVKARDTDSALFNMQQARLLCSRAAAKLRVAKFLGMNGKLAAEGLDEMVSGLERTENGLRLRTSDPARSRQEILAGNSLIEAGARTVAEATRQPR